MSISKMLILAIFVALYSAAWKFVHPLQFSISA